MMTGVIEQFSVNPILLMKSSRIYLWTLEVQGGRELCSGTMLFRSNHVHPSFYKIKDFRFLSRQTRIDFGEGVYSPQGRWVAGSLLMANSANCTGEKIQRRITLGIGVLKVFKNVSGRKHFSAILNVNFIDHW